MDLMLSKSEQVRGRLRYNGRVFWTIGLYTIVETGAIPLEILIDTIDINGIAIQVVNATDVVKIRSDESDCPGEICGAGLSLQLARWNRAELKWWFHSLLMIWPSY